MPKFFTTLFTVILLAIGGIIVYGMVNPGFSVGDLYNRYANTMQSRANNDAKEYLTQILNDPSSYQPASNSVDSVFYTKQELVDEYHKYTPQVEKENYYKDLIEQHKLKEVNVMHFYRAKNGFGALTLGTLKMHYTPSALEKGRLDLEPLILTNQQ